ncbi:hypothetical protein Tgr7_2489 [Thioalkalivibrio sulfidiphilus HL-EbGr7]|uniref:Uncharacterized protein n=1 Tax=Thioalkalivibrio sulfidiphilus (strain HL-EbGR7) TaxID=396588 RepID=B8GLL1_THISH|nr:hypothetical protein Tgr7_2489 [Thioalkalivibrio sulfidiphilus HL-EbGr7]
MCSLKYIAAQLALFGIAVSAFLWSDALGVAAWTSLIVAGAVIGFFVVFLLYRRDVLRRGSDEKHGLKRSRQPWE